MKKRNSEKTVELELGKVFVPGLILTTAVLLSALLIFAKSSNSFEDWLSAVNGIRQTEQYINSFNNGVSTVSLEDDPYLGNKKTAKVAVVEFSDYECPYCQQFHQESYDQIIEKYVDTGEALFVFKDFPLSFHDPLASFEALAAECVQDVEGNEKYFEFGNELFARTKTGGSGLQDEEIFKIVSDLDIEDSKFMLCLQEGRHIDEIKDDIADGSATGIKGTPGFVIGVLNKDDTVVGVNISGAQSFEVFDKLIQEQLEKV